jgi:hypothetical protein
MPRELQWVASGALRLKGADDQDLEILIINELGREIYRQFVHRERE